MGVAGLIGYLIGSGHREGYRATSRLVDPVVVDQVRAPTCCTLGQFARLQPGMTIFQVEEILSAPGTLLASSQVGTIKTDIYTWHNSNGSNLQVTIQNGRLAVKAQFGLR